MFNDAINSRISAGTGASIETGAIVTGCTKASRQECSA